jgi:hypothetical protein
MWLDRRPACRQGLTMDDVSLFRAWLHLCVLWAFAVAQPLFAVLADAPEFFVARGNTRGDIVVLALAATFVAPTLALGVEALAGLVSAAARRVVHLGLLGLLIAALALELLVPTGGRGLLLIPLAALAGVAGGFAYARTRFAPALLTVLAPAPLVFLVFFLAVSPVSALVLPRDDEPSVAGAAAGSTPVVMVVFDELPGATLVDGRGRVDAKRFPAFTRLGRDSTWYRYSTAASNATERAVPALLTGLLPESDDLPIAAHHPGSLFTLLGERYEMTVTEPVTDLCPARLCGEAPRPSRSSRLESLLSDLSLVTAHLFAPDDLSTRLAPVDRSFGDFRGGGRDDPQGDGDDARPPGFRLRGGFGNRPEEFESFIRAIQPAGGRPRLYFLHVGLPHVPWQYLPSGQSYGAPAPDPPGLSIFDEWTKADWPPRQAYQRYLLQLGYTDRMLGRLIARMRAAEIYDRALLVVASDHGESLRPGTTRRRLTPGSLVDLASTALFIKAPGQQRGRIVDFQMRAVDVLPTMADHLGVDVPWDTDGSSGADGPPAPGKPVRVTASGGEPLMVPFAAFRHARDRAVARKLAIFGSGGLDSAYRLGAPPALFGLTREQLGPRLGGTLAVELDDADALASVDPGGATVPAFITGTLASPVPAGARLAVLVNGRLAAVTRPHAVEGRLRFGAMVSPRALRRGANDVEVVRLRG